jgi:predicted tellurium resistance membrane protein TerC
LDLFSTSALLALAQVLMINIVLSGDNAVVIGMVAARVAPELRRNVILWGMGAAVLLRVALSIVAVDLLNILGLSSPAASSFCGWHGASIAISASRMRKKLARSHVRAQTARLESRRRDGFERTAQPRHLADRSRRHFNVG